ncbi:Riboflavin synthase-like beta-barrel [Nannochloropsis gaditana]|uniref:Riboflavin synthase n=1 Tax=Nannochloropsis gaditana TaxID=72520 RepID=W7TPM2_9STRA|nr:Riboflavin synthase-like beta-barrel [Nannochloropsis gaditana]
MRIFELPTLTLSSPTATSWRRRALHLPSHLPVFLLALILLGLFTTHAFRLPSHVAGGTTSSINRAGSLLAPISSVASAGRRRGKALALFSGIVEQMGRVQKVEMDKDMVMWSGETGKGMELTITDAARVLADAYEGCSIAVNGVCLTVVTYTGDTFTVGCAPETIRCTNLGGLGAGERVNLERSLPADGRNSGHMVQGHVDETGEILERWQEGDSLWVKVRASPAILPYIVEKGYIAVDGTSLTVCQVDRNEGWFTFMLIAYTQKHIIVPHKAVGDRVNLEVDVLAKYVEHSMGATIESLRANIEALQERVAVLEGRGDQG